MSLLILVVDDEPDVEVLFRQQFRRDLRAERFTMEFAPSAPMALQRIADAGDQLPASSWAICLSLRTLEHRTSRASRGLCEPGRRCDRLRWKAASRLCTRAA